MFSGHLDSLYIDHFRDLEVEIAYRNEASIYFSLTEFTIPFPINFVEVVVSLHVDTS